MQNYKDQIKPSIYVASNIFQVLCEEIYQIR